MINFRYYDKYCDITVKPGNHATIELGFHDHKELINFCEEILSDMFDSLKSEDMAEILGHLGLEQDTSK